MDEPENNVRPIAYGLAQSIAQAFDAIWPDFFIRKYAVTIMCGRCNRPYTYWVRYKPSPGNLRKFCDECVRSK